ncbi:hypothetical protein ACJMK2_011901 [Sinanodonta woodiana]|uniref:Bacteriophage T5 Orf172 DNA-binding domain-containing protein n=1 Tax=Sinanodonta woodiana TaxID=1069815 RepID=A0ABD3V6H2_SINWO
MFNNPIAGAGAGRHHGPGFVYVMHDPKNRQVKIGYSMNPEERLIYIQRDRPDTTLVNSVPANEMNRAETAAQHAVEKHLGMHKIARNATDWYHLPRNVTADRVFDRVRRAVRYFNTRHRH